MKDLDKVPPVLDTSGEPAGGAAMPLYRVFKMRRRDRRRRPWLLWWHDPPGGQGVKTRIIGPMCERLAERHREAWQAGLNGLPFDDVDGQQRARWADFCDGYLGTAAVDLAPASVAVARQTLKRFADLMRPRFLCDVGAEMLEAYRVRRLQDVGQETARKDLRTLRAAFAWGCRQGWLDGNPCDGIRFARRDRSDPTAMTLEQTARFLEHLKERPTWVQASLRLAALWGPRAGELAGVLRDDVDFAGGTLRIPATADRTTKTRRGKSVPLDAETAGLLQELSHRDGPILWGPREAPHTSERGFRDALGAEARAIFKAMGVRDGDEQPLQFLRRTAETNMRRRGVPDWQIGRILGHGTRVGEQWYNGIGDDELARQVEHLMRTTGAPGSPRGPQNAEPTAEEDAPEDG